MKAAIATVTLCLTLTHAAAQDTAQMMNGVELNNICSEPAEGKAVCAGYIAGVIDASDLTCLPKPPPNPEEFTIIVRAYLLAHQDLHPFPADWLVLAAVNTAFNPNGAPCKLQVEK